VPAPAAPSLPLLTPRLRLRALREADLDDLFVLFTHPRVSPFIGPHTRAEVAQELTFHIARQAQHPWSMRAVEDRDTGRFLGTCGLQPLELRGPEIELGYDFHPRAWGRGLATEAARASLDHGLGTLRIERIVAVVKPTHAASRRVLEKAGLTLVGERDAYDERGLLYEISRSDWRLREGSRARGS
jgi:RimJ/RimL family protein N-acetyltransferase